MHGHKRLLRARTELVNGFRDQFLARAALAQKQYGRARGRDLLHHVEYFLHHGGFTHDVFKTEFRIELLPE